MKIEKGQVLIDIKLGGKIVMVPPTLVDEELVFVIAEDEKSATITIPETATRHEVVITLARSNA